MEVLGVMSLLWWLADAPGLGPSARAAIASAESAVAFSAASAWEIAIKRSLGKLETPDDLPEAIENTLVVAQRCAYAAPKRKPGLFAIVGLRMAVKVDDGQAELFGEIE